MQSFGGLNMNLESIKNRISTVMQNYQIREKRLVATWKSLEFEVKTLKEIIEQMKDAAGYKSLKSDIMLSNK